MTTVLDLRGTALCPAEITVDVGPATGEVVTVDLPPDTGEIVTVDLCAPAEG